MNALIPCLIASAEFTLPDGGLRDIAEPIYIINWWYVAGMAIAAFLTVVLADRLIRKLVWHPRKAREEAAKIIPPYEEAMQQLSAVKPLMAAHNDEAFSVAVSQVLRRYIERQFEIRANEMTTEEFLPIATGHNAFSGELSTLLTAFLGHVDLVKFAQHNLDEASMNELFLSAERFIRESYTKSFLTEEGTKE